MGRQLIIACLCFVFGCGQKQNLTDTILNKWIPIGPFETPMVTVDSGYRSSAGMGWIESLDVDPFNSNILYAGSNSGGLFKSEDKGENWYPLDVLDEVVGVTALSLHPNNPNELLIGTGTTCNPIDYGFGVFHSTDGGLSWNPTNLQFQPYQKQAIWAFDRSMLNPNKVAAITENRVYISEDGGLNWQQIGTFDKVDLRHVQWGKECLMVGGRKLFKYQLDNKSWTELTDQLTQMKNGAERIAIAFHPRINKWYFMYKQNHKVALDISYNNGQTIQAVKGRMYIERWDINHAEIEVCPWDTQVVYAGAVDLYRSNDGGKYFSPITSVLHGTTRFVHADVRELKVLSKDEVWVGHDGGVSYTINSGVEWVSANGTGLTVMQFYGISVSEGKEEVIVGGCQDLGNQIYYSANSSLMGHWENYSQLYGDGGETYFLSEDSTGFKFLVSRNGYLHTLHYPQRTYHRGKNPGKIRRYWMPMETDGKLGILAGDYHLYQRGLGGIWRNLTPDIPKSQHLIWAIHQAKANPDVIWFAKHEPTWNPKNLKDKLYKTRDGGESWQDLTSNLPILAWRSISAITSSELNEDKVWVGLKYFDNDTNNYRLFKTTDGGLTWSQDDRGLPNRNITCMYYLEGSDEGIFVGTDVGLYYRKRGQSNWREIGAGVLPRCIISDLEFKPYNQTLYVATYGRGVFKIKLGSKFY